MTEPNPFDELHELLAEAYRNDDAMKCKLSDWIMKNDPRPPRDWPKVSQVLVTRLPNRPCRSQPEPSGG